MSQLIILVLMIAAAMVSLVIWGKFIYSGLRRNNVQETMKSVTVLCSLFIWFAVVLIQEWASSLNSPLYSLTLNLGYLIFLFALVALWRVVLFLSGDSFRFILKLRGYRMFFTVVLMAYTVFYLFASGMFLFPSAEEMPTTKFVNMYTSYGLLSVWPAISFGWPLLHLAGTITLDALFILITITFFMAVSISFVVFHWQSNSVKNMRMAGSTAGSGVTVTLTSFACCGLPLLYPILANMVGSTAAQALSYRMIYESGPLFSLFQIAILSVVTATTVSASNHVRGCEVRN